MHWNNQALIYRIQNDYLCKSLTILWWNQGGVFLCFPQKLVWEQLSAVHIPTDQNQNSYVVSNQHKSISLRNYR